MPKRLAKYFAKNLISFAALPILVALIFLVASKFFSYTILYIGLFGLAGIASFLAWELAKHRRAGEDLDEIYEQDRTERTKLQEEFQASIKERETRDQ